MLNLLTQLIYVPFLNLLTFFIWATPGHYAAVGIILLTLFVRILLISPSRKAAQAQRKIAQVQPLLEDLKKEYADDRQGLAAAQMELYKKNNISPFSSCGQSIIQLVILVILYHVIRDGLAINNPNLYHWLPQPPFINTALFGINLLKPDKYLILPILASMVQFAQIYLTMPRVKRKDGSSDPTQAVTQNTLYITSLFPILIGRTLPAAIALYWVVGTLFMVVQQYYVNKEKFNITGVTQVLAEADKEHPGYHRSKAVEAEIMEETSTKKGGVSVTVRRKK